jgi:pyruvate dehydrogenase E2 component (dihydrolipoamide acetyltransferase)
MAEIVVLPQQGNSVEEVVLLEWRVAAGDTVAEGDILCEVETDKATMEVESTAGGTVLKLLADAGDTVPVKTPIVVVGNPGEDISGLVPGSGADTATNQTEANSAPAASPSPAGESPAAPGTATPSGAGTAPAAQAPAPSGSEPASGSAASPRARMRAAERGIDPSRIAGSGPDGRVIERDVLAAAATTTAAAGSAAGTAGIAGTGIGGRITAADAAGAAGSPSPAAASPAGAAITGPARVVEEIPVAGVRKVIAERMHASLQETAQLTMHASADARSMQRLRRRLKRDGGALGLDGVNLNDMVMFAVARTLLHFPEVNSHFTGSSIRRFEGVDLGFAVDTPRGLLVPTIQGAHALSLAEMSRRGKELARRAIDGKAGPADLAPATFTVTNLGAFGVERFTPVLNPPQVAILGVGSIELKALQQPDGSVEHIPHMGLSLTIDHQAVDGAPGARFLQALSRNLAAFDLLLVG